MLEGNYPDTSRLIPSESRASLQIDTKELLRSIDRASLLAKENRNNVVKLVTQDSGQLEISSNSPEVGRVVEEVTVQEISGEELRISFSAKI